MSKDAPRLIAFYLPQFHPIPENDVWWGKGFTEWRNVAAATPRFEGHAQPVLPSDLGFYDLRMPQVRRAQTELASAHGITAFCYYHYWFEGRQILGDPFADVLRSGEPDFPFCLCWANENWTRVWDGRENALLLKQTYSAEDDLNHITALMPALRDRRYVRVDGKPLFLIYRSSDLPDPERTSRIWREEARKQGVGELFLASVETFSQDRLVPAEMGFDAAVEFQPDWMVLGTPLSITDDGTRVFSYESLGELARGKRLPNYRYFRTVLTSWDNTPRRRIGGTVLQGSTPETYAGWLRHAIATTSSDGEAPLVFVNAWNEWAEGAHLEPDLTWGHQYLDATRTVVNLSTGVCSSAVPIDAAHPRIAVSVCIPIRNGEAFLRESITSVLDQIFTEFELLLVDDASEDNSAGLAQSFDDPRIRYYRNPTRLGLAANWNRCLALARGDIVTVFHQDDVMAKANLEQKVAFLDRHPTVGFVHSNVLQIDGNGQILSRWWDRERSAEDEGVQAGRHFFKELFCGVNSVSCPSVVARRTLFEAAGKFDTSLAFTADWEMWLRAALYFDVGYLIEPLVSYRRHHANETLKFMGVEEIRHGYKAKALAIEKCRDRLPDYATLSQQLVLDTRSSAVTFGLECLKSGELEKAVECLLFIDQLDSAHPVAGQAKIAPALDAAFQSTFNAQLPEERAKEEALRNALEEIAAFRRSLSWRLTAPLRAIGHMLGRP